MNELMIVATCTFGLEKVLKREVTDLGYKIEKVEDGKIYFKGSIRDIMNANLHLRCAGRVLLYITSFFANSFDELFDNVNSYPWENIFDKNAGFNPTRISSIKSKLFSKRDIQKIVKKAIVERMKSKYKLRSLSESGSYYEIFVNIKNDKVSLFFNTSGAGLHKRGYRENALKAPLKETLASGIIELSGYRGDRPFSDVMCGSGTIVIEAAMKAKNIAPGLKRNFAFEKWQLFDKETFELLKEEARSNIRPAEIRLLGSDLDYKAIKLANENARKAGVEDCVAFQKLDMRDFRSKKKRGTMIVNPPYAERIGQEKEVIQLYKDFFKVYENLDEWKLFVLCAHPMFQKYFGIKADKNRKLFNGNMLCYLYQYYPSKII
ncbi:class I SAM-dependent RNA methyltransferase [Anaerofustis sp.]|uniref:THUMP domain-containing class I SAM-dependent RNA methyltransferase n=1 Tax=Anaerofustis sp. TaxID=1872517 RepID=UPI0025B860E1|nr:class I SAM-dependent RNA methyltransferase [Anaerofustis sp.]